MKVSIIMCAYNSALYIERAIDSIINQTYKDWELIVSDDASTQDNTIEIVQRYAEKDARIKLYAHKENKGYLRNKNWALQQATGDLITQLDADDTSHPERLDKQIAPFLKDKDLKITSSNFELVDTEDNILECKEYKKDFLVTELMLEYPFWFPGLMCKPELFEEFGYFDDYFDDLYGDDHYWTFLVNYKYPIYFVKEPLYRYRINPNSITAVYDNPRKMMAQDVLKELHKQITETGTDWLQKGEPKKLQAYEQSLQENKDLMSERFRTWAAKTIDKGDWVTAKTLLKKQFEYKKTSIEGYKTLLYYFRKRYLNA